MLMDLLLFAILVAMVKLRHYLHWGKGRWLGVPVPDNVIPFRRRE